ncbi:Oidioi.mRNA.OKI2018_I69.chr2.g6913.t1.cds [Oikopleura dioica]|uniref:Oidioi.mRNA.OKI2018_I69.chr2.g6913.t1.cds n=1 Tax=Oikopleura dioica TaxID=34765 RepID=A0ABN7TBJ6_OIKDI|nr:Oidioi.mRNA.OKI2018_I69.chr2.g6913.t1.cds [Oikopleura dioica]
MSQSVRSDRGSSRRSSTTSDFSESDFKRLEELREIGKSAKREARDLDIESMPDSMMSSASTALTKAERKRQLAIAKTHKLILTKKPREILKEEEYLSDMDKLITRDFFPHYDHVKDQHDYLIAEEEGDVEAMREIQMKHKKRQAERPTTGAWTVGGTPFLEGTPAPDDRSPDREKDDENDSDEEQEKEKAPTKKKSRTENISLDRYCTKFTSEDNDSFQKVHKFTEDKKKEQYAFLYAAQEQGDMMCEDKDANKLMAPEKILAIEDAREPGKQKKAGVGNWKYTNKNSLFYGAELEAQKEYIFKKPPQPREIVHENTRFKKDPFLRPVAPDRVATLVHNRIKNTLKDDGKVGIDGKPITPGRYGFSFGHAKSMPGVEDSPFMTWGQLEATPQRAMTPGGASTSDSKAPGVSTIASNAPSFRMDSSPTGINLLTEECTVKYLDEFDILDQDCFKATLAKGLGLAIIAGSILVKVPQILSIIGAKSAAGLSLFSVLLELFPCATLIGYGLASGFPFSSWGESFFMAVQTMIIAFLICDYTGRRGLGLMLNLAYAGFVYVLISGMVTVEQLQVLQLCNLPVTVISRLIQVVTNFKNGHCGTLSGVTCGMLFAGGLARVFTSFQETGDMVMIMNFSASTFMSFLLCLQLVIYKDAKPAGKKE